VRADELLALTESTEATAGERAITAVSLEDSTALAIGTSTGIVKRWNRESPSTMDSWPIIELKDGDAVVFAAPAADDDRLVLISSDSSLLTFEASQVRPQGRNAAGMAGIRLAEGCSVVCFNVIPAGKIAWTYEEGENGLSSQSGAVVLTVAGDSEALPGTENGAAKLTPLEMYPIKGRGTGGVRSQRFLKGQDVLLLAWVGAWPLHVSTASGAPVELPQVDMRRDASGQDLAAPIAFVA
jgi:DNA gyrase subunit A